MLTPPPKVFHTRKKSQRAELGERGAIDYPMFT
jgi:hypothetical protein